MGDKGALRIDLTGGLKDSYEFNRLNAPLLGITETKIFEIGAVFGKEGEVIHVATADKKGIIEMTLTEYCEKNTIVVPEAYSELTTGATSDHFVMWSPYPFITRDIAVWVHESVTAEELQSLYQKKGTELLARTPQLFDQFTKDGKTSYAFRLVFQSQDRTLIEEDVQKIMASITAELVTRGWEVR